MALHDEILREILAGRIPFRFKIRDLKGSPGSELGRYKVRPPDLGEIKMSQF